MFECYHFKRKMYIIHTPMKSSAIQGVVYSIVIEYVCSIIVGDWAILCYPLIRTLRRMGRIG